ncbi:MAG: FHA domain-containing protein [Lachnospiraceae bacterium]|nr:FHA domain-containing protein [Lachnospiraceae bacterium]
MQIEYKKEWMDTYLWVLPDVPAENSYVEQMLLYNQGEGRLEFSKQEKDGVEFFCYKVTGKKALNSIYAVMPIREQQIRGILSQLFDVLQNGREYLLCEEDFVLAPNYIFATLPQMELEFCYVPGYGVPLREQLEGLFEYLLNRVDYEDKQAVSLLYDCYMFCMKEKGGLAEIKKLLEKKRPMEYSKATIEQQEMRCQKPSIETKQISEPRLLKRKEPKQVKYPEQEEAQGKKATGSYVSWLTERIFPRSKKEIPLVAEERAEYGGEPILGKMSERESIRKEELERTVLLSEKRSPSVPELVHGQTGEVVLLTKFPFYIGSATEYADLVLQEEGVSRIHCSINKKGENYYLADLNSINGTYVNQKEVLPGKDVLLSENDEIRVISQEFYIKFPCH